MAKILLIEDDTKLVKYIKAYLSTFDYQVYGVEDFDDIEGAILQVKPQLILLDINLPRFDGFYILKCIRRSHTMPVIILSARSEEGEQIRGMELGADDYITKPFSIGILLAKVNASLRRASQYQEVNRIENGNLVLLEDSLKLQYYHKIIELSKNEYKIMKLLMQNPGKVVSRDDLFDMLTDYEGFLEENTLNVNISRIKVKLKEIGLDNVIRTRRGMGYVFDPVGY